MNDNVKPPTLLWLIAKLPFKTLRVLGSFFGLMNYHLNTRNVKISRKNIAVCLPRIKGAEREHLVKQSCRHSAICALESIWVWFNPSNKTIEKIHSVEGKALLDDYLTQDQPLVITGSHLGNWEALLNWIATITPCSIAFKEPKNTRLAPIIKAAREKAGVELVPGDKKGIRRMFEVLSQKGTFIILSDQKPGKKGGVFAPFFQLPAYTMTIVQTLVKRSNANLLLFYAKRTDSGFSVKISKPDFDYRANLDEVEFATALNKTLAQQILEVPEQFEWSYRKFRPQPEGAVRIYEQLD